MVNTVLRVLTLAFLIVINEGARILCFFPTPSISHQFTFRALTQELARKGHDVVVITPDPAYKNTQAPVNITEIDVHDVAYDAWIDTVHKIEKDASKWMASPSMFTTSIIAAYKMMTATFKAQVQHKDVKQILKDKTIDLLILEAWPRPLLVLSHLFKVPVIQISSYGAMVKNFEIMGAARHPLLQPYALKLKLHNLSTRDKIIELHNYFTLLNFYNYHEKVDNDVMKRLFGEDVPPLNELANNVDIMFLNLNPIWEGNWSVPPSIIYLGGIHMKLYEPKDLPQVTLVFFW